MASPGLPLRATRRVPAWWAVPVVRPPHLELAAEPRPRIYIAPLSSAADRRVLRASLTKAGLAAPRWVPSRRARVDESRLRDAFLRGEPVVVPLAPPQGGPDRLARLLVWAQQANTEVDLVPAAVLWGPEGAAPSTWNVLLGNPYDPPEWSRWGLLLREGRVRVILGLPGELGRLRAEAPNAADALALSAFVRRQAVKALSGTERQVLGDRYKVPRLVVEDILGEPDFRDAAAAAGSGIGLTRAESLRQAERGLRELATGHNPFSMELFRRFVRWLYTRVYDPEIVTHPNELEGLRELGRHAALVFIPSHKSNFDHLVLYYLLFSAGFPPPHTAAGINMAFFPMNRILPGTGAYFIRRAFQDDPVYKECLRAFVRYLVTRRFHQEFFIEGGRTRSGKLLPPRYGMLRYIVDGARHSGIEDVCFVPTAIAYDQVAEVGDYVREQLGAEKEPESFGFLVRLIRSLRRRDLGRVYVRFAEPISLRGHLRRAGEDRLVVEKLAFQIAHSINASLPLTAVAAVCSALLGAGRRALTLSELERELQRVIEFARENGLRLGRELEEGAKPAVRSATDALGRNGVVDVYEGGTTPVWFVQAESRHAASFYRNTLVHFFLVRAIAALAQTAADEDRGIEAWALRLRDLLKFEFFFNERETFLSEIEREKAALGREAEAGVEPLLVARPRILLDYLESYLVVMRTLRTLIAVDGVLPEDELFRRCHAIGNQHLLQDRVHAPELLSSVNFRNALDLAENLGAASRGPEGVSVGDARVLEALEFDLERLTGLARK